MLIFGFFCVIFSGEFPESPLELIVVHFVVVSFLGNLLETDLVLFVDYCQALYLFLKAFIFYRKGILIGQIRFQLLFEIVVLLSFLDDNCKAPLQDFDHLFFILGNVPPRLLSLPLFFKLVHAG